MIDFTKMEGLGNDYIYVDCTKKRSEEIQKLSKLAQKLSDRHFGIGSDGLILICKSDVADFKMTMFNQDGSQAEMCGNGIRCVGKFVYEKHLTINTRLKIETLAGIKYLELKIKKGKVYEVSVDMGEPILEASEIPVISNETPVTNLMLNAYDKDFKFTCVSMGNPHAVTFVDDVDNFDVNKYGSVFEIDNHFPNKSNIEFVQVIDEHTIKMRVWERGAGETLACGTGASASVVACVLNKFCNANEEVTVILKGGNLKIKWDETVYMTGPANIVFEGSTTIE